MSEDAAAMFWEVDPDPRTTSQRESTDSAPYLEKAAPPEGVTGSPEMAIRPAPEATRSIQAVECSTTQAAPPDMAQDTKPAAQPCVTSSLGTTEAMEKDITTQRSLPGLRLHSAPRHML